MNDGSKIEYINIMYLLNTFCDSHILDENSYNKINSSLAKYKLNNKKLIIIDMENVKFSSIAIIDKEQIKKSVLFFAFKDFINNLDREYIFINVSNEIYLYLLERDFPKKSNVYILTFIPDLIFLSCESSITISKEFIEKNWYFIENKTFYKSRESLQSFIDKLISYKIKNFLLNYKCIHETTSKDENHVLNSTPVHVNKYINLKPLIERFDTFNEICFYLSLRITKKVLKEKIIIVAASKNAISIASGLLKYLNNSDLIIINQVSPITIYSNYSNLSSVKAEGGYAIIEDFHCMGTEIKIIKGILWSRGINEKKDVYSFPIASTNIYNDFENGFKDRNIYPLYILDNSIDYKMFTINSCPVCNELDCEHRKLFNI